MKNEKIKHRDFDLLELIKAVCGRPQMYVGCEDFRMIASFIDGFAYASDAYSDLRVEFGTWLALKLGFPRNWVWTYTMEQKFSNDEDALRELPKLFEEFINSRNK